MLTVCCYLWTDEAWKHSGTFRYGPQHVNLLHRMVSKNLSVPHEFVCITDMPTDHSYDRGFDIGVRLIPLDPATHIPGTEFAKLMTFHPKGREMIGERVLQLDLDTIICRNIDHIVDRDENLVVWRNPTRLPYDKPVKQGRPYYNGSVILHKCGTLPRLWTLFDRNALFGIRDTQVWMSLAIGPDAPYWDGSHGVYRLARADTPGSGIWGELPANACIVNFVGSEHKPWNAVVREANPWVAEYWPE